MRFKFLSLLLLTTILSGCLYVNVKVPLDEDVWETQLGSKTGVASTHSIMWLVAWGDGGVKAAADKGGIKVVKHMDAGVQSYFFGAYSRRDTIVYGD